MILRHHLLTGSVFHFADGSFIRCFLGRGSVVAEAILEENEIAIPAEGAGGPVKRFVRGRLLLRYRNNGAGWVEAWVGNVRKVCRMPGKRFLYVSHYFFPRPGVEEALLGLW